MKTPHWLGATAWLLSCGLWCADAQATPENCMLDAPAMVVLGHYDPSAAQPTPVGWNLAVRTRNPKVGCRAHLQMEVPDSASNLVLQGTDPAGLRLSLSQDAGGNLPVIVAPQEIGSFDLEPGGQAQFTFWAWRGAGQWVSPGLYRGTARLNLFDDQGRTLDRRDVDFQTVLNAVVRAGFGKFNVQSGLNSSRLAFGELTQGATRHAMLAVQSNTAYTITLSSAQQGRLVNRNFPSASIAYLLRIDGVQLPLTQTDASLNVMRRGQQNHDIEVEIGPVQRVIAGEYADNLLITISAQ